MKLDHIRADQNHMATTFSFTISCPSDRAEAARRTLEEAHAWVSRLEFKITEFKDCSPVRQLNRSIPGTRVPLNPETLELLERSERLRVLTGGAFDCAAKSRGRPNVGPAIGWDRTTMEAWRLDPGVHIGFGAIGKGYALDGVRALLERAGFTNYLLSAGGSSLILSGYAGVGTPWNWGWSWSKDAEGDALGIPFTHVRGTPIAIGVSGTHEKGEHLMDPRHAAGPARLGLRSALVATSSAADADALSTALFVAGYESATRFLAAYPLTPALAVIDAEGCPSWNGIFKHYWGKPGEQDVAPAPRYRTGTFAGRGAGSAVIAAAALGLALSSPHAVAAHAIARTPAKENPRDALAKAAAAVQSAAAALEKSIVPTQGPNQGTNPGPAEPERSPTEAPSATASDPAAASEPAAAPDSAAAAGAASEAPTPPATAGGDTPASDPAGEEGAIDLGGMSANTFAPYVNERSFGWILLPLFALSIVLVHLKKTRRNTVKKNPSGGTPANAPFSLLAIALLWTHFEAHAVDLLPMGKALVTVLGTPKAFKKVIGDAQFYYSKNPAGKADKVAFVEHNVWQKSCTHTWIVGIGPDGNVLSVVAQEQQCPHARPAAADSFLDQYKGKGPADVAKLKDNINTVAKATGSCELATDAVVHAVKSYQKIKGKI